MLGNSIWCYARQQHELNENIDADGFKVYTQHSKLKFTLLKFVLCKIQVYIVSILFLFVFVLACLERVGMVPYHYHHSSIYGTLLTLIYKPLISHVITNAGHK